MEKLIWWCLTSAQNDVTHFSAHDTKLNIMFWIFFLHEIKKKNDLRTFSSFRFTFEFKLWLELILP